MACRRPHNSLAAILSSEALMYADIPRLCPPRATVSAQTVAELAAGVRWGSRRSWERIQAALTAYCGREKYPLAQLLAPCYEAYLAHWQHTAPMPQ